MGYSEEEKHEILILYYENNASISLAQEFRRNDPGRKLPCTKTIKNFIRLFRETKSLMSKRRTSEENAEESFNILLYFQG